MVRRRRGINMKNSFIYLYFSIRKNLKQQQAEYEQECQEYLKNGYRPQYCKHGTNMWVDWDCACWRCESEEYRTLHQETLDEIKILKNTRKRERELERVYQQEKELLEKAKRGEL